MPGSQAVAPLAASPPSPGWPSWRRVGRLAGAGTCCLEASSAAGSAASELLVMVGGWQPAEQKFPRTLVDRRTAADPGHPTQPTQPACKLFTTATNLLYYCLQEVVLKFTLCFSLVELVKDLRKVYRRRREAAGNL